MTIDTSPLFRPIMLGSLILPNRIAMAPMTRSFSPEGVPGPNVAAYYRRRAENDVGLIITEGTTIDDQAAGNDPKVPYFHGRDALAGWERIAKDVHAAGGKIMPQLWHVGSMRRQGDLPHAEIGPASPSGLFKPGKRVCAPLSVAEIDGLIASYARSARNARELGFDGIEIHGAHGYLIDQFFWSGTNERDDRFGGGIAARAQFAAEIVKACRAATGPDFPIVLRFSQWKQQDYSARLAQTPEELGSFLAPLVKAGIDIFHCSTRRFWEPEFPDLGRMNLAGWTKKITGKPVITVGSVGLDTDFIDSFRSRTAGTDPGHLERLLEMMTGEGVDLVALGRVLLSDPAWARKLKTGQIDAFVPYTREALAELV